MDGELHFMFNVEKTYVIHYTKLEDRKISIENFFKKYKYENYKFIEKFDKEELTEDVIAEYYEPSIEQYDQKIKHTYANNCESFRKLKPAEISCTIKHFEAIKKISEECSNYGFIIEDDIYPINNFGNNFNNYLEKTPKDWDAIFMGNCCSLRVSKAGVISQQVAFLKQHPATKCADAYLIKRELAEKITNNTEKFCTISDWELSYLLKKYDAKVYWWEPNLICQGSEIGTFKSTLR
jgi:GR25 family glycosyltransferase involved in LPS biosynthesis